VEVRIAVICSSPLGRGPQFAALAALALLVACATDQAPRIETQIVKVPVPVPCVAEADIPAPPAPLGARPATLPQALDLALAKVGEWKIYGAKAGALFAGCASP
jgi:hypothetical protein